MKISLKVPQTYRESTLGNLVDHFERFPSLQDFTGELTEQIVLTFREALDDVLDLALDQRSAVPTRDWGDFENSKYLENVIRG
jgi:hypothetical protein